MTSNNSRMAAQDKDTSSSIGDDKLFLPEGKSVKNWADDEEQSIKPTTNHTSAKSNNNNNTAGTEDLADKVKNLQSQSKDEDGKNICNV